MAEAPEKKINVESTSKESALEILERQLSSVVEQDNVVLNTPRGVIRRKKMFEQKKVKIATPVMASSALIERDAVEALDRAVVNVHVGKGGGIPQHVPVFQREHARSEYVVSLQHVILSSPTEDAHEAEERVPEATQKFISEHRPSARPVAAYAAVSVDLALETDPWSHAVADQFTPATFDEAYQAVYGKFDRVSRFFAQASSSFASLFQRIERVEKRVEQRVEQVEQRVEQVEEVVVQDVEQAFSLEEAPRFSFVRALAAFAGLAFVVTLPANAISLYRSVSAQKDQATVVGQIAVDDLLAAKNASSVPQSAAALRRASTQFQAVDSMLGSANALAIGVASLMPKEYRSARALVEVGDKSSEAARLLELGFDKVFADPGRRLDERLDVLNAYAKSSLSLLSDASAAAATIDPSTIPEAHRADVTTLLSRLSDAREATREFAAVSEAMSTIVGKDQLRKYLVIFQNPTELRPTGGFMGSFAEVTVDQGAITGIRVPSGGTYDIKGQLTVREQPPKPLSLVAPLWQFQDSNWSPDFPTAAKKIEWFWSKSKQSSVDGVIAINATFVEKLLAITGPIDMPDYRVTVDQTNFMLETQKQVELDYDKKANTPKKFIGDLETKLMDRMKLFTKDEWLKVAALTSQSLQTKDIQVAFTNSDEEALAERYSWNGRLKQGNGDSLALIETNIAGQKTDGVITESVAHNVSIAQDGEITDTVKLTRTHNGKKGDLFSGVRNVSYLRTYVPKGSDLLSASGFQAPSSTFFQKLATSTVVDPDIAAAEDTAVSSSDGIVTQEEDGETSFGGWMQLDPGQTKSVTLSYTLPFRASDILAKSQDVPSDLKPTGNSQAAYLLLLTSQSGKASRELTSTISYPASWNLSWHRPDELQTASSSATYATTWDQDHALALFFSSTGYAQATTASP